MFKNYFKIAIRNLVRHKGFSFINIAGLTLGITAVLLIGLFVWDEKQYDHFIPEADRVYRIYNESTRTESISNVAATPPMFVTTIQQEYPEVEQTLRIVQLQSKGLFEKTDKKIYEEKGILAEPSFFHIFPLQLKYGSVEKALDDPHSIVISEQVSERYFGGTDPVGQTLSYNKEIFQVKAVLKNDRSRFHLAINYILPMAAANLPADRMQSWRWQQFYTYVKLKKTADIHLLQSKFQQFIKQKVHPITKEAGFTYLPVFQSLQKIHLYSAGFKFDMALTGNITYVNALTIIGIFILLIACFNFINLSTAKSVSRAKEVGVRKSIGASRKQLIMQFIGETMLLALISVILSVICTLLLIPSFNQFTGKALGLSVLLNPVTILLLTIGTLLTGVIAGSYPAIVLSGFQPVKVLKGILTEANAGQMHWLRRGLVVVQFAISGLLIISAIIVYQQVSYLHNKDIGFNKEELLFFPMRGKKMNADYTNFKTELLKAPGVRNVSLGYGFPGDLVAGDDIIVPQNGVPKTFPATQLMVDADYLKTFGVQLIAGRDFLQNSKPDEDEAFIINETAVKELGFGNPQKAIGQLLMWNVWFSSKADSLKKGHVIGVVKDFNYKSLYDKVSTAILQVYPPAYSRVAVKVNTAAISGSIQHIKEVWGRYSPDYPVEYKFLDENFEQMYKAEDKLKVLLSLFTGIAIFVGCLGLFGLAAYTAERKTKEIGIRKVLGASVSSIVALLSKDFLALVLIAFIIASPVAWYLMHKWLQDFAYRINIGIWVFVLAAVIALCIAMLTISIQAIKAAMANPIKSLRTE